MCEGSKSTAVGKLSLRLADDGAKPGSSKKVKIALSEDWEMDLERFLAPFGMT